MKSTVFEGGGLAVWRARARGVVATALMLATCLCLLGACARSESAADRQMAQLREDIRRVQTDHDRVEQRLSALEVHAADDRKPKGPGETEAKATDAAPRLRVVRLRPDGTEEHQAGAETASTLPPHSGEPGPASTEDGTPRPSIRVTGAGGVRRGAARRGAGEQIEQTEPDEPPPGAPRVHATSPRPSALDPEAKRAYDAALALVNGRQYDRALEAFAGFLVRYPDHPNADNALYWRGECYFAQGDFTRAAEQFDGAITRFPMGNKVPDALLKLGICQSKLGLSSKAKVTFERLAREFPRSEAARRVPREETP